MYYRRKVLLALLEVFNGNLNNTDCEKLLFDVCKVTSKNHYDFFPYRFGPFSFVSYYDKRKLTELGLLKPAKSFRLNTGHSYFSELATSDKEALIAVKEGNLRGNRLLQRLTGKTPNSPAEAKFSRDCSLPLKFERIQVLWNTDTKPIVFTVGYEGETIESFLYSLIANNIIAVVDVRNNPQSMKYGFSKKSFSGYIEKVGMKYFHIPELGIPSAMRKGLGTTISHQRLFEQYVANLLPLHVVAKKRLLDLIAEYPRVALVCFKSDHRLCHRHALVEFLQKEKSLLKPVVHL